MTADRAFPALLRYWRSQRGLSQLDLGLNAGVSARHLSFLETGRSRPSVEMVLLLLEALDVPLRSRNEVLRAAGFDAHYPDPGIESMLAGPLALTIGLMLRHHEPFPMLVVDRHYEVAATNRAAARFLALAGLEHHANIARLLFDADARPLVDDWQRTAGEILRRLQREVLHRPGDEKMAVYNDVSVDQPLWLIDSGVAKDRDLGEYESMSDFQWRTRSGDIVIPRIEMSEPLKNEITAFGEACTTRVAPRTNAEHGVEVVRVLEAIDRSAQASGRPMELSR